MEIEQPSHSIIHNQILWNNRYITIQNKNFLWKNWKDAGIMKVADLLEHNNFLSADELSNRFTIQVNFL